MRNDVSRHWTLLTPFVTGDVLTRQSRQIEAAGLRGIACPSIYGSALVPLSHIAAVTSRVQLQSAVLPAFPRSPFETAVTAMDLDRLSGGRLVLGLGPSYREWNEGWFGMPDWGNPVEHLKETIEVIRLVFAKGHTGELARFEGRYHKHDWRSFPGVAAPPLREQIPIWIAANRLGLVRLAGEVADGIMNHAMWSTAWTLDRGLPALAASLAKAGRRRSDIHWQAAFWMAVSDDRRQAVQDAKWTVGFYGGMPQFQSYFAAHGFEREAVACQAALQRKDHAGAAAAVTDEMSETFVVLGSPDECRRRLARIWDLADSFLLVPPIWGVSPEQTGVYAKAIGDTFYA